MTDPRVDDVLARWEEGREAGRDTPAEELCRDCPELLDEVRKRIVFLRKLDASTADLAAEPAATPDDLPTVPGYELLGELGRGGMGVVYRAIQQSVGRPVALKMVLGGRAPSPREMGRLRSEAAVLGRLRHPNVVQVYDVGMHDGRPYFSLELVAGGSLADKLVGGPLDPQAAVRLVAALARALHAVHQMGIVHRDLKPGNVLLEPDGTPKVTDFGLARRLTDEDGDPCVSRTESGAILGTPAYMAPEQAAGNAREAGPLADVYGLGAVLYHCLTGRPPFHGLTFAQLLEHVLYRSPAGPRSLRPLVPRDLDTVCLKCLEKDPARRYASAELLAVDLENVLAGRPVLARPVSSAEQFWRWCRRRPYLAGTGAVAVAALLAVAVLGIVLAVFAERKAEQVAGLLGESEANRRKAEKTLAEAYLDRGLDLCHGGDPSGGLWWFVRASEACPPGESELASAIRVNLGAWRHGLAPLERVTPQADGSGVAGISSDGKLLAVARGGTVGIEELTAADAPRREVTHGQKQVRAVAFHPTEPLLATGGDDGAVRLWHTGTLALSATFRPPQPGVVAAVAFSPDGAMLAAVTGSDATVWEVNAPARPGMPIKSPAGGFAGLAFVPGRPVLATAGSDGFVRRWELPSGAPTGTPLSAGGLFPAVGVDPTGKLVAATAGGERVAVYDLDSGRHVEQIASAGGFPNRLGFELVGTAPRLLVGDNTGKVRVWELTKSRASLTATLHGTAGATATFAPDVRRVVTAGSDRAVRVWRTPAVPESARFQHAEMVRSAALSPDGRRLATGLFDGHVQFLDGTALKTVATPLRLGGPVHAVRFHPDGSAVAAAALGDPVVRFWDPATGQPGPVLPHPAAPADISYARGGLLASAWAEKAGGALQLWDPATGRPAGPRLALNDPPRELRLNPDGSRAVVLVNAWESQEQRGRAVWLWNPRTGEQVAELAHEQTITAAAFAPDGTKLVTAALDGTVRLWHAATGRPLGSGPPHSRPVRDVTFAADGIAFASASEDGTARVWAADDGRLLGSLPHGERTTRVAFGASGGRLLTVGDQTVRVWDRATFRPLGPPWRHGADLTFAAFTPDGRSVLTTDAYGTVRAHSAPTSWDAGTDAIKSWLRARTGLELDAAGSLRPLSPVEWEAASAAIR